MTTKKTLKDLREDFAQTGCYLDSLAIEGKSPECKYPNNGVPEQRDGLPPITIEDIFACSVSGGRE